MVEPARQLPPRDSDAAETLSILRRLEPALKRMEDELKDVKGEIKGAKAEITDAKGEIKDIKAEIKDIKAEQKRMGEIVAELRGRVSEMPTLTQTITTMVGVNAGILALGVAVAKILIR